MLHRNERPPDVAAATTNRVPSVLARLGSGELLELLGPHDLDEVQGDVARFRGRLMAALDERSLALA